MELVYLWLESSQNYTIHNQEINFSTEYDIHLIKNEEKYQLNMNPKWDGRTSIFKQNLITNVNAIVGKNGTGKTTLLYEIARLFVFNSTMKIVVIKDEADIQVFHNIPSGLQIDFLCFEHNVLDDSECGHRVDLDRIKKNYSLVYITNSYFESRINWNDFNIEYNNYTHLSPHTVSHFGNGYFSKLSHIEGTGDTIGYKRLGKVLEESGFYGYDKLTGLMDILYYSYLVNKEFIHTYQIRHSLKYTIDIITFFRILELLVKDDKKRITPEEYDKVKSIQWNKQIHHFTVELLKILVLEIHLLTGISDYSKLNDLDSVLEWVFYVNQNHLKNERLRNYLNHAVEEIVEFNAICTSTQLDKKKVIQYDIEPELFSKLVNFFQRSFESNNSFILKYLKFNTSGMSSGERAFQNIMSWIKLIPIMNNEYPELFGTLKENIIVLIDEVDLYLHPAWQRDFLFYCLEEFKRQYKDSSIHLILATHSPMCLSDIPRENTIYLDISDNGIQIDDRMIHRQSFGMDLYSLLADAFYLENSTMGRYAESYINQIIQFMYDAEKNAYRKITVSEYKEYRDKISWVGNNIIKRKLMDMLTRCVTDSEIRLEHLKKKRAAIQNEIDKLENYDKA